jgi:hypothetical protein
MDNFYIFLDIDGVMYDWKYISTEVKAGRMTRGQSINRFKPESVDALNFLIEELEKEYNDGLVISSTWRSNLPNAIKTLKNNGLIYDKVIDRTPLSDPIQRGKQISDYLSDKENFDFVIIDDEMFDFKKYFKREKIIKCNMFNESLNFNMVESFLRKTHKNKEFEFDKY